MKRALVSISLVLLTTLQAYPYKQQSIDINVNGQQRNMVVFTPNTLPAKSPLFIVTHGMNQSPEYQYGADKMYEMIDTAKFVVTYLRSDGSTWDIGGTKDQNFVIRTIEEMASRFDIDKDRVYWSGFSMGSMLIHHCIANMQDRIAAFAPTSGIQFSESPWNNCKKPVNLLECIAYGDDVFGYEQYGIHAYIENYAKHDKHPNYTKTPRYRPIASSWFDGDLEKWTGGPNGGEVWLYSYNNGGHWPMDLNRHLIWNFCKRFSLHPTRPTVTITQPSGESTYLCLAPEGEATFPDITVCATAKDPNGTIEKVEFYDNGNLFDTQTATPYQATLTAPSSSYHNLRVVVTDNDGETSQATCRVDCVTRQLSYSLHQSFTTEGGVPQGWYVSNGSTKRVSDYNTYTAGPRLLHFTNTPRAFEYGLLVQNNVSRSNASWAKYGVNEARSSMTLYQGHYALKYKLCNWNRPEFTPVIIAIEEPGGQEVASQTYTPTVNIGGKTTNTFTGVRQEVFEFYVPVTGEYVVALYTGASRNADFVLGQLNIQALEYGATGITPPSAPNAQTSTFYDLGGRRLQPTQLRRGVYIIDGHKTAIK